MVISSETSPSVAKALSYQCDNFWQERRVARVDSILSDEGVL